MNKLNSILLICVLALFGVSQIESKVPFQKCDNVVEKLEAFALGKSSLKSGVTLEELKAADEEASNWTQEERKNLKQEKPMIHLFTDLLVALKPNLDSSEKKKTLSGLELTNDYIRRFEAFYKLVRKHYQERRASLVGVRPETEDLDNLIELLLNEYNSVLMKEDFDKAFEEYNLLIRQLNEIPIPEMGQYKYNIQGVLNVLNEDEIQLLARWIFPQLSPSTDSNQLENFKEIFKSEMEMSGFKAIDERLKDSKFLTPT